MPRRFTFLLLLLTPVRATAQDTVDAQLWTQVLLTLRLSENWRVWAEEQPRWSADQDGPFQILTRGALGRQLNPRVSVWGGYAWVAKPPGPGVAHEHRIWEQLMARFPNAGHWIPSLRLRVEQRFQDGWGGASHRLRPMLRGVRPMTGDRRWSLVGWDELFVTMNESPNGPWQGWDQNRLFGGLLRQFSPKTGLEFGYMWQRTFMPGSADRNAHIAFVWLNLSP